MLNKKALAASVSAPPVEYVEDVFSTYLYTGTGTTQTITNNIDLAGEGGMVWTKTRSGSENHWVYSTAQGTGGTGLITNTTDSNSAYSNYNNMSSFNADGFTLGTASAGNQSNPNGKTAVSWTFRKAPKFFDIQQVTLGTSTNRQVAHNLASTPGVIIGKKTNSSGNWVVYHRSLGINKWLALQSDSAETSRTGTWGTTNPTTTNFYFDETYFGSSGDTYIFYIFAHNAGGFGAAGTDNIITCGSYTGNGSSTGPVIDLGYEPQWVIQKRVDLDSNWHIQDVMRGMPVTGNTALILPNSSTTEYNGIGLYLSPTATGFQIRNTDPAYNANGGTYIYIAIRRPMKTPTDATKVFNPVYGQSGAPGFRSSNFNAGVDTSFVFVPSGYNDGTNAYPNIQTRLIGTGQLQTANTRAEVSQSYNTWDYMNGQNNSTFFDSSYGSWLFKRATGFHDVVCYTGTGSARTITHNLGAVPELIIVKARSTAGYNWNVYSSALGASSGLWLNDTTGELSGVAYWNSTSPTSSVFSTGSNVQVNASGTTYVAYLFATVAGVSKVGSYTGNGSNQTINCGFTAGARFVMIKRTDSTGDWYVWDTVRGIVSGNDPYLLLNTYGAQVTNTDYIDPANSGFEISSTAPAAINANGGSFIFMAIA